MGGEGSQEESSGGGEETWPPPPSLPHPGPSHRHTPSLAAKRPRTKKPNLPACMHICPAAGQAPAVLIALPPHGPRDGGPKPDIPTLPVPPPLSPGWDRATEKDGGQRQLGRGLEC
jgi:hypothetical protein